MAAVTERPERPCAAIRVRVTMDTIPSIADRIPEVIGWLAGRGVEPEGAPFLGYRVIGVERALDIEAGVPVTNVLGPAPEAEITTGTLARWALRHADPQGPLRPTGRRHRGVAEPGEREGPALGRAHRPRTGPLHQLNVRAVNDESGGQGRPEGCAPPQPAPAGRPPTSDAAAPVRRTVPDIRKPTGDRDDRHPPPSLP
ncbi:hypothetical protein [Streptomyces sp. PT12]|uniref:hypothetical protein n=1 Tax=Streptomyces sp. PT12 TaxID=1510197 RepID=UPI0011BDF30E|nr:hypothetical protein [Streptomyces sp. PT12]